MPLPSSTFILVTGCKTILISQALCLDSLDAADLEDVFGIGSQTMFLWGPTSGPQPNFEWVTKLTIRLDFEYIRQLD